MYISWTINGLISLMHGITMKIIETQSLFTADIKPITLRCTLNQKPGSAHTVTDYICEFFRTTVDVSGIDKRNWWRGADMLVHRGSQLKDTTVNRIATSSTICTVYQVFQV